MTPEQIALVQQTWAQVQPVRDDVSRLFYEKLFDLDSDLRQLFRGDMVQQGQRLTSMMDIAIKGLNDPDSIIAAVQEMGVRHAGYGVQNRDYDTVASALLWTLEQGLGDGFTSEVRQAWTEVYVLLASLMQDAAGEHLATAAVAGT